MDALPASLFAHCARRLRRAARAALERASAEERREIERERRGLVRGFAGRASASCARSWRWPSTKRRAGRGRARGRTRSQAGEDARGARDSEAAARSAVRARVRETTEALAANAAADRRARCAGVFAEAAKTNGDDEALRREVDARDGEERAGQSAGGVATRGDRGIIIAR